ncbi:MFS transporter [Photobacterium sp. 1_MG-2023]|uniref:MFS transporter n=1 Tax=Photobacterium sp. 1_MG-2023 TaxID=3062646 RepID=UPI0026E152F3|nr:MFS transporter [Photobacterium sp. 1_MG-2023]MDO6708576.1 MFS transporter [Photobacterium sp. 1_MG-2023]
MDISRNTQVIAISVGVLVTFWASSIKGSYQVYFLDLASMCGLGRGVFSLTSALFGLSIGILSPVVGWICDRIGPAQTILSGVIVAMFVYLLMTLTFHFWLFLVLFGVLAAYALTAMTFVPLALLVDRIFDHRNKGMAYAAITNGTAIGFMVLSPLWVWLNTFLVWQDISLIIFGVFTLLILPASLWLCRLFPLRAFVLAPEAENQPDALTWHQHLRKPLFLLLALSFGGCGASMAYIDVHLVPLLQERFSGGEGEATLVATSLSVLGAAELVGAFWVGYLLRFSAPALILAGLYLVRGASLLIVLAADNLLMCMIFAVLFGLTYMGTVIVTSMMCLQAYGEQVKGKIFGCLFTVHQIFVFGTVWLGGLSFDATQSYAGVTLAVSGLCFVSAVTGLLFFFSEPFKTRSGLAQQGQA